MTKTKLKTGEIRIRTFHVLTDIWSSDEFECISIQDGISLFQLASASDHTGILRATTLELAGYFGGAKSDWSSAISRLHDVGLVAQLENGEWQVSPTFFLRQGSFIPGKWQWIRRRIFERDKHTCTYCGATHLPLHVDHVVPKSKGGTNDDNNLVTACAPCNLSKSDKMLAEWAGRPS